MVLEEGENLLSRIEELASKNKIKGASLSAMGFVKAKFGFFDSKKKEYLSKQMEPGELASFNGSIAWEEGKPSLHSHAVVSGGDFVAYGGHLQEAIVGKGSVEVTIIDHGVQLYRKMDQTLGAKVLRME